MNGQTVYQVSVRGALREEWAAWLGEATLAFEMANGRTTITVAVPDQAALRGLLNRLWDLNLDLIAVSPAGEENDG